MAPAQADRTFADLDDGRRYPSEAGREAQAQSFAYPRHRIAAWHDAAIDKPDDDILMLLWIAAPDGGLFIRGNQTLQVALEDWKYSTERGEHNLVFNRADATLSKFPWWR